MRVGPQPHHRAGLQPVAAGGGAILVATCTASSPMMMAVLGTRSMPGRVQVSP